MSPSFAERFWAKVHVTEGCWLWTGYTHEDGYGLINAREIGLSERERAHRIAWLLARGPIPEGVGVLHSCDTPPCCNPYDLFLGTQPANIADKVGKGRHERFSIEVAARLLGCSVSLLQRGFPQGRWPGLHRWRNRAGRWMVSAASIQDYIAQAQAEAMAMGGKR